MTNVLIYPRGQLTDLDRARLDGAGIIAVEADDPGKVVTTISGTDLTGNDLLAAALKGIATGASSMRAETFAEELHRRMKSKEQP